MKTKQGYVIALRPNDQITLLGKCHISCLVGTASVLGFTLKPGDSAQEMYSPTSNSLLAVKCGAPETDQQKIKKVLEDLQNDVIGCDLKEIHFLFEEAVSLVLVSKLVSLMCDYIQTISPFQTLFTGHSKGKTGSTQVTDKHSQNVGLTLLQGHHSYPTVKIDENYFAILDKWIAELLEGILPLCKNMLMVVILY